MGEGADFCPTFFGLSEVFAIFTSGKYLKRELCSFSNIFANSYREGAGERGVEGEREETKWKISYILVILDYQYSKIHGELKI